MLRKFCIINTCGSEDCGNHQQDHEHGAYYLVQDVDAEIATMRANFDKAAELYAHILADKNASIAELERQIQSLKFALNKMASSDH